MPAAFLFDLDGTLYQDGAAIPGAARVVARLAELGTPCRYLTNTTSRTRAGIVARLLAYGIPVAEHQVFTAVVAGAELARSLGCRRIVPLLPRTALADLDGLELVGGAGERPFATPVDAVLVGDLAEDWSFELLQQGFTALLGGARLIALSRDRFWKTSRGLTLDAGPFVAALEYAAGVSAELAGKPSPAFYAAAIRSLGLPDAVPLREVVMVGDDLLGDVQGARDAGCRGWLVRTGKFREDMVARGEVMPDRILDSVADLLADFPG